MENKHRNGGKATSAKALAIGMVATDGQQGDGTTTGSKIFGRGKNTGSKIFGRGKNTGSKIFGRGKNTGSKIFGCGKNTDGQQGEGHDDFKSIIETIPIIGGL